MRSGRLKDQVYIQTQDTTPDAFGGLPDTWTTQNTRRCSIEPVNGKEYFSAQGENTQSSVRIRFRYESGLLSEAMKLVNTQDAIEYDIESIIDPGNEHKELICMCVVRSV